jgi:hypothetical protein
MLGIEMQEDRTWATWAGFIREACGCLDKEGRWIHLPQAGGYYDQDSFFMSIWECVRVEYLTAQHDEAFQKTLRAQNGKS